MATVPPVLPRWMLVSPDGRSGVSPVTARAGHFLRVNNLACPSGPQRLLASRPRWVKALEVVTSTGQAAHRHGVIRQGFWGKRRGKAGCRCPRAGGAGRLSGPCLASGRSVQAPGVGGDAPAAALLASDERGACPAQLYPLAVRAGAGDVPLAENQGNAVAGYDRADPHGQRETQVHQPDQGVRDTVCVSAGVTC